MSRSTSILRALRHHRWTSLAVAAGAATATAVLTGALVVGDSVRGSLRDLTFERLGGIDQALIGQRFVRQELVDEIAADPALAPHLDHAAPAILLRGSIEHAELRTRASQVGVQGIDERFLALFANDKTAATSSDGTTASGFFPADHAGPFPPVVINESLQRALSASVGDAVLLHLKRWTEVPRGSLLGRKETNEVVESTRLEIVSVIADAGIGRFGLDANQAQPLLAFVPRERLARALDQEGAVNALLLSEREGIERDAVGVDGLDAEVDRALARHLQPTDLGLSFHRGTGNAAAIGLVESDELILRPAVAQAATEAARQVGLQAAPVLAYLANTIALADDPSREIPYATVAALDPAQQGAPGFSLADGSALPTLGVDETLGDDEILLGTWAAEDLGATVGDTVRLDYFEVGPREELIETSAQFTVAGVVAMTGLGGDQTLVQEVPGIAGTENMADWDPPFPVELGRVRPQDETYWDDWRDTPKAFVSQAAGRKLWATRWGNTTSLRVRVPTTGESAASDDGLDPRLAELASVTLGTIPRDTFGLVFRAVKTDGLAAAAGATDFSQLFLGFSIFLIISAALLAALLFRLGVEQRAGEIGLQLALGFPRKAVSRQLLKEGTVLATIGAVIGVIGSVGYGAGVIHLLRTWWLPAVGTTSLGLHIVPLTLVVGAVASILVVVLSIVRSVRRVARVAPTSLLRRVVTTEGGAQSTARVRWTALATLVPAIGLLAFAVVSGRTREPGLFFAIGPLLLIGGLAGLALLAERGTAAARAGTGAMTRLGVSNARRNRGRSLLAAGLVATATFMIVTVAAFQHDYSQETLDRSSGSGGFALVAESEVPLLYDPSTDDGRFALGLPSSGEEGALLANSAIVPCRLLPGDDTSCLNLYRPTEPRILGVPPELIERQAFRFVKTFEPMPDGVSPWTLLDRTFDDGAVPAIGDANSMQYILKLKLGGDLVVPDQRGGSVTFRLVATLGTSIFQSEMLIAGDRFVEHFPQQEGLSYFLIDTPSDQEAAASEALEAGLAPYGFDAVPTREKLAAFHAVQNTYLSTFRTLGGLGLLLGTLGLAVVLLRNVIERRSELAAMRAFGFRRRWLTRLVVVENGILLLCGLALGTVAALITVLPQLLAEGSHVPWSPIASTLGIILIVGVAMCAFMASGALRTPLLEALKADR